MMRPVSIWLREARDAIRAATDALPADATRAERIKAIDAAYPFRERKFWPYHQWQKAKRQYLASLDAKAPPQMDEAWREGMRRCGYRFAGDPETDA